MLTKAQALNHNYRGKDYATNVLSFIYETNAGRDRRSGRFACPWCCARLREQGKPVAAHMAHLIVHGMLHLQGYDHETGKRDASRMENKERDILARFGIPDPYR